MKKNFTKNQGFTIAELLIATAVFSLVLLVALIGFLQIGHLFYKGVSTTQTQNAAQQIVADLSSEIQTADTIQLLQTGGGYSYYCLGNTRYTVNKEHMVDLAQDPNNNPGGNFGLLRDKLPGNNACATPCAPSVASAGTCPGGSAPFNSSVVDLVANKTRLSDLKIENSAGSPNLYKISLILTYGDDDALDYTDSTDKTTVFCKGSLSRQQFCSVNKLTTSVYKGFGI